jgi:AbrB family looped-hinge helix DNA binding protein
MTTMSVKVSKRYQIAVPSAVRDVLNIQSGDRLLVDIQDGMILLIPEPANYTQHLEGIEHGIWENRDAQEYIDQERETWQASPKP